MFSELIYFYNYMKINCKVIILWAVNILILREFIQLECSLLVKRSLIFPFSQSEEPKGLKIINPL